MNLVIADISISPDGYIAAPRVSSAHGLGIDGEVIHAWAPEEPRDAVGQQALLCAFDGTGAVVLGRRPYDIVDGPQSATTTSGTAAARISRQRRRAPW